MMKKALIITILIIAGCIDPKDATISMMSNIDTYQAIYQNSDLTIDTMEMGFILHKPPIDLGSNKPFRVLTKTNNDRIKKYELRSIQFDTSSWMEYVELIRTNDKSSTIRLTEHHGEIKEFEINGNSILVYKQTYNRKKNPKNNYSEFFTIKHGLILVSDGLSFKELLEYNGMKLKSEIIDLYTLIKIDSSFYPTDTTSIFEIWTERY